MVKRVIVGILAVLLLLGSLIAGAAAVWAYGVFGSAGVLRFDAGTITPAPDASATVIDIDRFGATVPYLGSLGSTTLSVTSSERGDPAGTVFIGAASTPEVDAFLKGSTYSVGIRDGSAWIVREVPGVAAPQLPREQGFWLAEGIGRPASIAVPEGRPLSVVIMHPSGIPSGPLLLSIEFSLPDVVTWITWLGAIAALLLIGGVVLLVLALRRPVSRGRHAVGGVAAATEPAVGEGAVAGKEPAAGEGAIAGQEPAVQEASAVETEADESAHEITEQPVVVDATVESEDVHEEVPAEVPAEVPVEQTEAAPTDEAAVGDAADATSELPPDATEEAPADDPER